MSYLLETDDNGSLTIPADLLGHPAPHSQYVVGSEGLVLRVQPANEAGQNGVPTHEQRMKEWADLADRISKAWQDDVSAVDAVSEQRRW